MCVCFFSDSSSSSDLSDSDEDDDDDAAAEAMFMSMGGGEGDEEEDDVLTQLTTSESHNQAIYIQEPCCFYLYLRWVMISDNSEVIVGLHVPGKYLWA